MKRIMHKLVQKMKNISFTFFLFLFTTMVSFAQSSGRALTIGNETYEQKHFNQSEAAYRIAHSKGANKETATYNLGNTLIRQTKQRGNFCL